MTVDHQRNAGIWTERFWLALLMAALATTAVGRAQISALPQLYITHTTRDGQQVETGNRPLQAANHERLQLRVCLRTRSVADPIEQLEIQALNQHPDYFRQRPGPNVTLSVTRVGPGSRESVPFRVNSSGGGKSLTVHYVSADIDFLEDRTIRRHKAQEFVDWFAAEARRQGAVSQALGILQSNPEQMQAMVDQVADQYVNNPPGDYEVVARYTPVSAGTHWRGTLVSRPFRVSVIGGPDFFDRARERMGAQTPRPAK